MAIKYQKVWNTMNDLEQVIAKVVSAREMIDVANDAIVDRDYSRAETMTMAAYEFLEYFIEEFDEKFKDAWQATVGDLRSDDKEVYDAVMKEKEYYEPNKWNSFWESYYPEESDQYIEEELNSMCDAAEKADKVKKWVLPVEECKDAVTDKTEYFVTFPDDLLEVAKLKEGDEVNWIDNGDGSFKIVKVLQPLGPDEC